MIFDEQAMLFVKYAVLLVLGFPKLKGIGAKVQYGIRHRDLDTETGDVQHVPRYNNKLMDEAKSVHQSVHRQNPSKRMNLRDGIDRMHTVLKRSGYASTISKHSNSNFMGENLFASSKLETNRNDGHNFDTTSSRRRAASNNSGIGLAPQAGPVGNGEPPFALTGEDPLDRPSPVMGEKDKDPPSMLPPLSTTPTPSPTPSVYLSQLQVPRGGNVPTSLPTSNVNLSQFQVSRGDSDPTSSPTSDVYLSQLQAPRGDSVPTSSPTTSVYLSQLQVRRDGDHPTSSPASDISLSQLQVSRNGNDDDEEMTPSNDGLSINYLDDDDGYLVQTHERTPSNDHLVRTHVRTPSNDPCEGGVQ